MPAPTYHREGRFHIAFIQKEDPATQQPEVSIMDTESREVEWFPNTDEAADYLRGQVVSWEEALRYQQEQERIARQAQVHVAERIFQLNQALRAVETEL